MFILLIVIGYKERKLEHYLCSKTKISIEKFIYQISKTHPFACFRRKKQKQKGIT